MRADLVWGHDGLVVVGICLSNVGVVEHKIVDVSSVGVVCCDLLVDKFVVGVVVAYPFDGGNDRVLVPIEVFPCDTFEWLCKAELQEAFSFSVVEF